MDIIVLLCPHCTRFSRYDQAEKREDIRQRYEKFPPVEGCQTAQPDIDLAAAAPMVEKKANVTKSANL